MAKKAEKKAPVAPVKFERVSKETIVEAVVEKTGLSKKAARENLETVLEAIKEQLVQGKEVSFVGFGTFKLSRRAARTGRNPQTGEAVKIEASVSPSFKASKPLKDEIKAKLK